MHTIKRLFFLPLVLIPFLLTSCNSSSNSAAKVPPPVKVQNIVFGKEKGLDGEYQRFYSVQGSGPLSGKNTINVTTFGDISSLDITISSENKVNNKYTSTPDKNYDASTYINEWFIDVSLPVGTSTVSVTAKATDNTKNTLIKKVITKSTEIQLEQSGASFSPGENFLKAKVTNYGDDAEFVISATDNKAFVEKQFSAKTIFLKKGKTTSVNIPVALPRDLSKDIHDYFIEVKLKNTVSNEINIAKRVIGINASPTIVTDNYKLVVTNLGSCAPVSRNQSTITVAIAGSSKLILDAVDENSIFWMNGRIKPTSVTIADKVSFDKHECDNPQPDGLNDLIMTFPLLVILKDKDRRINSWPALISYSNKNALSGDVLNFEMKVGE